MRIVFGLLLLLFAALPAQARADGPALTVVAAENVYGDIAGQIGGADVTVVSILTNPDQDPHLFEPGPSVSRAVAKAQVIICNGADYDPWMEKLVAASSSPGRRVIVAASLIHLKPGDNPHLWFDIAATRAVARAAAFAYGTLDPANKAKYDVRLSGFEDSLGQLERRIAALRQKYQGQEVTATEPVLGYLLSAIGLISRGQALQRAVMNETEASVTEIAAFEEDLKSGHIKFVLYNTQASSHVADQMKALATESHIPVIGVSESEPRGVTYQAWLDDELNKIEKYLVDRRP